MVFCKRWGAYSSNRAWQSSNCRSDLAVFGHDTAHAVQSSPFHVFAKRMFGGMLCAAIGVSLFLFFLSGYGSPQSARSLKVFLWTMLPWMYLVSFVAALMMLIAGKRWKTLAGGFIGIVGLMIILSQSLRSCGCSPQASPESVSVANLRTINTAEVTHLSSKGKYGTIQDLIKAGLLDPRYGSQIWQYQYSVQVSGEDYIATARPISTEAGRFGYYSRADAVVRYALEKDATCDPCFPAGQSGAPVQ
jgi:hypothetical protein